MREAPRQPRHLDAIDQEALAVLAHRIERWDTLLDQSLTLDQRKRKLLDDLNAEIAMLSRKEETDDNESIALEVDELMGDCTLLLELSDDPEAIADFHKDRVEYYRAAREELIKQI